MASVARMRALAVAAGVVLLVLLTGVGAIPPASAQHDSSADRVLAPPPDSTDDVDLAVAFERGVTAVQEGAYSRAVSVLRPVVQADPGFSLSGVEAGSAAFWLGEALVRHGDDARARQVWWLGVQAGLAQNHLDVQAADAYVRSVYDAKKVAEQDRAAQLYVLMLEVAGASMNAADRAVIDRHLAQILPVLPSSVRDEAFATADPESPDLSPGGGKRLAAWWRQQDVLPATRTNERVVEHLQRVAHATDAYTAHRNPAGYDDRGTIYVRFGAPTKAKRVDFHSREMMEKIHELRVSLGNNLVVSPSDFADNEFWLYERGGETPYYYLFVDDGNTYQRGTVTDMIPRRLQSGLTGRTGRGGAKADVVLEALRTCYRQLATYHRDFSTRYIAVDNYVGMMEETRMEYTGDTGGEIIDRSMRSDNSALAGRTGLANPTADMPARFARQRITEANREDDVNAYRQEERLPSSNSLTVGDLPELPVAVRPTRFLEEDGSTRVEFYWGVTHEDDLQSLTVDETDSLLVDFHVKQMDPAYRIEQLHRQQYVLWDSTGASNVLIPQDHLSTRGTQEDLMHFGLQWDQWTVSASRTGELSAERKVRVRVAQVDSLQPLDASPGRLEMSDIVPVVADVGTSNADDLSIVEAGRPYPFTTISPTTVLALRFEIYHLTYGADDRTTYTVRYDLRREETRGGLRGLFGGRDEESTATASTYTGSQRRTDELILLDARDWEDAETVTIQVEVTDDVSGQTVRRELTFDVAERL